MAYHANFFSFLVLIPPMKPSVVINETDDLDSFENLIKQYPSINNTLNNSTNVSYLQYLFDKTIFLLTFSKHSSLFSRLLPKL